MPPVVSVIVPAHNSARFLERALTSVSHQSFVEHEVIVVDDGSPDGTAALVEAAAARDSRVRLVRSETNKGPSFARNLGLSLAQGEWIAPLDADDWFLPDRLQSLLAAAEKRPADAVADGLELFDEDRQCSLGPMFGPGCLPAEITPIAFVTGNMPNPAQPRVGLGFLKPMFSASFIRQHTLRYDEEMRFAEDYEFYLNTLLEGARWITSPKPTYVYSVRGSSLTANHDSHDLAKLCVFDEKALRHPSARRSPELEKALRRHLLASQERYYLGAFSEHLKYRRVREALSIMKINLPVFRACAAFTLAAIMRKVQGGLSPRIRA